MTLTPEHPAALIRRGAARAHQIAALAEPALHGDQASREARWAYGLAVQLGEQLEACAATWPTQPVITTTEERARERRAALATARALLIAKDHT